MSDVPAGATLSGVAVHELRHDLAQARALLDQLTRPDADRVAAERAGRSLTDLLLRMETSVEGLLGGDPDAANRQPIRVGELISRIVQAHDPQGTRVAADVPSLIMNLDSVKMERIVDNLLANALHHTPGTARVRLSLQFDQGTAILCVADEGPGIPAEVVSRLEGGDGETPVPSGLGVVARFAHAHGGRMWITGPGAKVHVTLPQAGGPR